AAWPTGQVYVTWFQYGPIDVDYMKVRKSTNLGASFAAEVVADPMYSNFGTGAPGFNRDHGLNFPSIAVDRSTGPHRGRVYLAWNESVNWYDDPLGGSGSLSEVEPDDA